jgi:hypothetical protein
MAEPRETEPPQRNRGGTADAALGDLLNIAGEVVSGAMNGDTAESLIKLYDGAVDAAGDLPAAAAEAVGTVAEAVIDAVSDS